MDQLSSSRLQKAIERNKQKQMRKRPTMGTPSLTPSSLTRQTLRSRLGRSDEQDSFQLTQRTSRPTRPTTSNGAGRLSDLRSKLNTQTRDIRSQSLSSSSSSPSSMASRLRSTENASRVSVARNDDVSFTSPLKRMGSRLSGPNYNSTTRKRATPRRATQNWFSKALTYTGWGFCALLLGRLLFAERGVMDYYSKQGLISEKISKADFLKKENQDLQKEIYRIDNDPSYQKKLARKHLGVIAGDEYLILFAREDQIPSTLK